MIRIYNFAHGARGLRAAWVCEEMGLPYEVVPVTYPPDEAYRARHRLGTVPFLEDDDVAIGESIAIMLYLTSRYGPTPLSPPDPPAMAQVLEWAIFGEASLGACLNPLLAARFGAPPEQSRNWSVEMLERRVHERLAYVTARLSGDGFLVGGDLTLADISVVTALSIWRGGLRGAVPPLLTQYRDRVMARAACRRALAACA